MVGYYYRVLIGWYIGNVEFKVFIVLNCIILGSWVFEVVFLSFKDGFDCFFFLYKVIDFRLELVFWDVDIVEG